MQAMNELIGFLESARRSLETLPTRDELGSLRESIETMNFLFERATNSPAISAALGLELPRSSRARTSSLPAQPPAVEELDQFKRMTIDQIRDVLNNDSQYTVSRLYQLARALGARVTSRSGREALANQILTKVTTMRGYQQLGATPEVSNPPSTD